MQQPLIRTNVRGPFIDNLDYPFSVAIETSEDEWKTWKKVKRVNFSSLREAEGYSSALISRFSTKAVDVLNYPTGAKTHLDLEK